MVTSARCSSWSLNCCLKYPGATVSIAFEGNEKDFREDPIQCHPATIRGLRNLIETLTGTDKTNKGIIKID